jgi:hypothetical protein
MTTMTCAWLGRGATTGSSLTPQSISVVQAPPCTIARGFMSSLALTHACIHDRPVRACTPPRYSITLYLHPITATATPISIHAALPSLLSEVVFLLKAFCGRGHCIASAWRHVSAGRTTTRMRRACRTSSSMPPIRPLCAFVFSHVMLTLHVCYVDL